RGISADRVGQDPEIQTARNLGERRAAGPVTRRPAGLRFRATERLLSARKLAPDQSGISLVLVDRFQAAEKRPNLAMQSAGNPTCEPASGSSRICLSALGL